VLLFEENAVARSIRETEADVKELSRRTFIGAAGAAASGTLIRAGQPDPAPAGRASLALTCADYVRFMPIATGDVRPKDLALTWIRGDRTEMLRRATGDTTVDGGETSMAQHVMRLDAGDRSMVAIPIFPLRNFTVRDLYTRKGSPVAARDLGSSRIGIYNWAASGAVWYRHLIRHLGHDTRKVTWVVGGTDAPAAVRIPDPAPSHVRPAPAGTSLSDLLLRGDIDALFSPLPPARFQPVDGPIVRVFPDFRTLEQRYYADTACYPPQHVIVIRRATWEKNPAAGARLVEAFNIAEARFEAAQRQYPYNSPWLIGDVEDAARLMGADYHTHGIEKNRRVVDVFCQAAFDDGLTKRRVTVDEWFSEFLKT
jgi:4,5-dihydroxyphthalate decarboxylase